MQYFNHNLLSKLLVLIDSRYVHLRENSTEFLISCRYVFGKLFIYLIKTGVHKMGSIKGVSIISQRQCLLLAMQQKIQAPPKSSPTHSIKTPQRSDDLYDLLERIYFRIGLQPARQKCAWYYEQIGK